MSNRAIPIPLKQTSLLVGAMALALAANSAHAADWRFDPRVALGPDYDDNNRLTNVPGQEIEVFGALLDAQFTLTAATPRSDFVMLPRVRATFYPDDHDEQTDSEYLLLDYEVRGQRYEAIIDADISRRETLGRYLPDDFDDDLGNPDDGDDLGVSPLRNVQKRVDFTPSISFEVTERSRLEFGAGYIDVNYEEQVSDDREDFASVSGDVGYRFLLSPTKSIAFRALARQYDPADDVPTDSQELSLEWWNRVSENSRVYVSGGGNRAEEIDEFGVSTWSNGFTGGAGVQWAFEVTDLFLDVTHGLDPNSSGRLVERDEIRFRVNRKLSPVTVLQLTFRGVQDGQATQEDLFQERDYVTAGIGFEWRMTRQLSLGGGYQYVWRSIEDELDDAQANRLFLGVVWEPNRL
jgi:hypothetical protein